MKKKLLAGLLVCAMTVAALTGCGGTSDAAGAAEEAEVATEETTEETTEEAAEEATEETTEETTEESAAETTENSSEEAASSGEGHELIFVCPIVGLEYWNMCVDGIEDADAEFGTKTQVVGPTDPATFATEMVSFMESAIASKPDGILCYAGVEAYAPLFKEAADQGIPIVAIDSDCSDPANRVAYVGTDPYNAGFSSGEAMLAATGGEGGEVAVLTSTVASEKEQKEIKAFEDAVEGSGLEIVVTEETNADLATGVQKMESIVQTYPNLRAVLCTSAYDVQAAAKVKEEFGLDDLVLVGYDDQEETLNYIRKGVINAIIVQDPYMMGYQGVEMMNRHLNGETFETDNFDTGTVTVTIDNVDNYKER